MVWSIRRSNPFDPPTLSIKRQVRWAVASVVTAGLLAAAWGVFTWWPDDNRRPAGLLGEDAAVVSAEVTKVALRCPSTAERAAGTTPAKDCGTITVRVDDKNVVVAVPASATYSPVEPGDRVRLAPSDKRGDYTYLGIARSSAVWWVGVAVALSALALFGERGARTLLALALVSALTWWWLLPALLQGRDPWTASAVVAALGVAAGVCVIQGASVRTGAAVLGGWVAAAAALALAYWLRSSAAITGVGTADAEAARQLAPALVTHGLWVAAMALAVAGVVAQQAVAATNAIWEVRAATPRARRSEVVKTALRATRDHAATTVWAVTAVGLAGGFAALALTAAYDVGGAELLTVEATRHWFATWAVVAGAALAAGPIGAVVAVWIAPGSKLAPEGFAHRTYGPTS